MMTKKQDDATSTDAAPTDEDAWEPLPLEPVDGAGAPVRGGAQTGAQTGATTGARSGGYAVTPTGSIELKTDAMFDLTPLPGDVTTPEKEWKPGATTPGLLPLEVDELTDEKLRAL